LGIFRSSLNYHQLGKEFDVFCVIFSTAPFTKKERLQECYNLLVNKGFDSVFPVIKFNSSIFRSLKIENGKVSMNWPENLNKRSQDLPDSYHDSGQFYRMKTSAFNTQKKFVTTHPQNYRSD